MSSSTEPAKRIPLRDFFRNPERASFQVSPDGSAISFMQPYQRRMNVFVQPRGGGPAVRVTGETERDVMGYGWKGPGRIIYLKDFKGDENYHLVSVGADGTSLVDLTPFEKVRVEIVDYRIDHDDEMIYLNPMGMGIEDLSAAEAVYMAALKSGSGVWLT